MFQFAVVPRARQGSRCNSRLDNRFLPSSVPPSWEPLIFTCGFKLVWPMSIFLVAFAFALFVPLQACHESPLTSPCPASPTHHASPPPLHSPPHPGPIEDACALLQIDRRP